MQTLTRRAKERGARVATGDRDDSREHEVLDEGARDDDLNGHPNTGFDCLDNVIGEILFILSVPRSCLFVNRRNQVRQAGAL